MSKASPTKLWEFEMMNFAKHCGLTTRAALLGLTALASFGAAGVAARVGVTAATEGAPVGRPPQAVERVLHVGIDVQANEQISTKENDRAQLLFIDGTALTVGPNAQLTIDKFVYRPSHQKRRVGHQCEQRCVSACRWKDTQVGAGFHHHAGRHDGHSGRHCPVGRSGHATNGYFRLR